MLTSHKVEGNNADPRTCFVHKRAYDCVLVPGALQARIHVACERVDLPQHKVEWLRQALFNATTNPVRYEEQRSLGLAVIPDKNTLHKAPFERVFKLAQRNSYGHWRAVLVKAPDLAKLHLWLDAWLKLTIGQRGRFKVVHGTLGVGQYYIPEDLTDPVQRARRALGMRSNVGKRSPRWRMISLPKFNNA